MNSIEGANHTKAKAKPSNLHSSNHSVHASDHSASVPASVSTKGQSLDSKSIEELKNLLRNPYESNHDDPRHVFN